MVVKIVKTLLKHIDIVPIAKVATVPAKSVQKPIGELLTGGAKNTVTTGINGLKSLRTKLSPKIEAYNARKLAVSKKFGTSDKILNNWNDSFGIANKEGVYQNAINHLNKSGSIDDYIIDRIPNLPKNSEDFAKIKKLLNQYLEKNLDIYSYSRIEKILNGFNKEIAPKLKNNGIIYVHDDTKSYGIITELYKTINPDAKIVTGWNNLKEYSKLHKDFNIVMLDDCLVSGESASKVFKNIKETAINDNIKNVDLYVLSAFEKGVSKVPKGLNVHYSGALKQDLRNSEYFKRDVDNKYKGMLMGILGTGNPEYNAYSAMMFEYMAPNNNSKFGAQMIKQLFTGPECSIKGVFEPVVANDNVSNGILKTLDKLRNVG